MAILENELTQIYNNYYMIKGMGNFSNKQILQELNELCLENDDYSKQSVKYFFIMLNNDKINKLKLLKG